MFTVNIFKKIKFPLRRFRFVNYQFIHTEVDYDIIINGGGIIGTSMALGLSKNPHLIHKRVLLLENRKQNDRKSSHKSEFSNRVTALSVQNYEFLKSINVWEHIAAERYKAIRRCHVLDGLTKKIVTFESNFLSEHIAYIVENPLIFYACEKELSNLKNVNNLTTSYDSRIESIQKIRPNTIELMLQDHNRLTCHLLIGADGFNSRVRELTQLNYYNLKYNKRILLANIQLDEPMKGDDTIWLKFNEDTAITLYPLSKTELSIMWYGSNDLIQKIQTQTDVQFVDFINETFWEEEQHNSKLPPKCSQIIDNSRESFPVNVGYAPEYIKENIALIGSAAHQPHQFGGKGLNLGFVDVQILTNLIGDFIYKGGASVADPTILRTYQRISHTHNFPKVALFILVYKLYSSNNMMATFGRNICSRLVAQDLFKNIVLKLTK